jgi:hypothetical protein
MTVLIENLILSFMVSQLGKLFDNYYAWRRLCLKIVLNFDNFIVL